MAYNAVSQDLEVDSDTSRSPSPRAQHHHNFQQLPLDTDHIGGGSHLQMAKAAGDDSSLGGRLSSMIRSITSVSYDMVEEEDYEATGPAADKQMSSNSLRRILPPLNTAPQQPPHADEPPLRTPVTDTPVPLSHPTPDLQSLQGAYINNVERLERSAERLSSSSADIASEIRKMNLEQKRRSVGSVEGSPLRNTVSPPQGSIQLAQVSQHGHEAAYNNDTVHPGPVEPMSLPHPPIQAELDTARHNQYVPMLGDGMERPDTAASGDTYQQARFLFNDFDGVHFVPHDKASDLVRRVSLTRPPLAKSSESYKEPQTGENMVYYPAPVPMMLNLPPRLSRKSNSDREKRRTQLLAAENRRSAAWLSGQNPEDLGDNKRNTRAMDNMPPQLRASVFFEPSSVPLDVQIKQASAVATLDSILDASAHAPVTAFTDHPFAGSAGGEVYRSSKHKASTKDLSEQRRKHASRSSLRVGYRAADPDAKEHHLSEQTEADGAEAHEGSAIRDDAYDEHEDSDHSGASDEEGSYSDEQDVDLKGLPNTLLGELERRKHELKHRKRTVAGSTGLHSTLLQLEAVAQKQSENRRHRPVTLAWEDPDVHKHDDEEDDDVPLAMLFPEKAEALEETRPLGLMEKRQMEDSEPLSRRRARLRGEALPTPGRRLTTMYAENSEEPAESDSGEEGETLAQRLKRLKVKDRASTITGSEFANEILAELNLNEDEGDKEKEVEANPEEETLAQRRARLQKEAVAEQNQNTNAPRYRKSMADIIQARPSTGGQLSFNQPPVQHGLIHQHSLDNRMSTYHYPQPLANPVPAGLQQYPGYMNPNLSGYGNGMVHGMVQHPNTFYSDAILGMNPLAYAMPNNYHPRVMRPGADNGQREMIDRWRQSIR